MKRVLFDQSADTSDFLRTAPESSGCLESKGFYLAVDSPPVLSLAQPDGWPGHFLGGRGSGITPACSALLYGSPK